MSRYLLVCPLLLAPLHFTPGLVGASPQEKLTVDRVESEPSLSGTLPTGLQWHSDGKRLTFVRRAGEATKLMAIDTPRGETSLLVDGTMAARR
jgi:dipeptidyl-peptidase-4